jgi:hypothetical protein
MLACRVAIERVEGRLLSCFVLRPYSVGLYSASLRPVRGELSAPAGGGGQSRRSLAANDGGGGEGGAGKGRGERGAADLRVV